MDSHQKEQINNYLIQNEGIVGFGGDVYCDHMLIGQQSDTLYMIVSCQEYYQVNDSEILDGTGFKIPAVLTYKNGKITDLKKPRDGAAFSHDISRLFPPKFVAELNHNLSSITWIETERLQKFKKKIQEERRKNLQDFESIQRDSIKVDFYGAGSEPFWSAYIMDEEVLIINSNVISRHILQKGFNPNIEKQVIKYNNHVGDTISIEIIRDSTYEELSDKSYPYKVIININPDNILKGVGDIKKL